MPAPSPSKELLRIVRTMAEVQAGMSRKQRDILKREYGVKVDVTNVLGDLQYTVGSGRLMPDLRFMVKENRVLLRSYKPGDWEAALKRAHDDLLAQAGVFGSLSAKLPEPAVGPGKVAGLGGRVQLPKRKGIFDRLMGIFSEPED